MQQSVNQPKYLLRKFLYVFGGVCLAGLLACAGGEGKVNKTDSVPGPVAAADTSAYTAHTAINTATVMSDSLLLPTGFTATTLVAGLGRVRHIAVAPNGAVFVKLSRLQDGKGIYRLMDTNGDGKADKITGFGDYLGTGMAIRDNYLYTSTDTCVYRYKLDADYNVIDPTHPEKIVTGLLSRGEHEAKAIALDYSGNLYVNIGAYSNACQLQDRQAGSPGQRPCPILDSAGGIWQFKADQPNQTYGDDHRYATGIRNVVGFDWNKESMAATSCISSIPSIGTARRVPSCRPNVCMSCTRVPIAAGRTFSMINSSIRRSWRRNSAVTARKRRVKRHRIR
jgi:glucose/arabinose dehydrogenase